MARPIPEGYELLPGRSTANARKAIELAGERGVGSSHVLTQTDGYLIPLGADSAIHAAAPPANVDEVVNLTAEAVDLPTEANTVADIDAFAKEHDITVEGNKAEKLAAIQAWSDSLPVLSDNSGTETKED